MPITAAACSSALAAVEPVDSGREDRLDGGGHAGVLDRLGQPVGAALALEVAGLDQLADDLLDEERVAAGSLVDQLGETVERGVAAGQVGAAAPWSSPVRAASARSAGRPASPPTRRSYSGRKLTTARVAVPSTAPTISARNASLPSSIQCRSSITLTTTSVRPGTR